MKKDIDNAENSNRVSNLKLHIIIYFFKSLSVNFLLKLYSGIT